MAIEYPAGKVGPLGTVTQGILYTLVILLTMDAASWWYYQVFGVVEVALTGYAAWLAIRWPRAGGDA